MSAAPQSFVDQWGKRRATIDYELNSVYSTQRPLLTHNKYEPPFATVDMKNIEKFKLTDLYGYQEDSESDDEEQDVDVPQSMVVKLPIGREACRWFQQRENNARMDSPATIPASSSNAQAGNRTIPPSLYTGNTPALSNNNPIPPNPYTTNITTTNATTNTVIAAPTITTAPPQQASPQQAPPQQQNTPIPLSILTTAIRIQSLPKNSHGLPKKTLLMDMDGFVKSHGNMRADNPLKQWYGDLRLFDDATWKWLCGEKQ